MAFAMLNWNQTFFSIPGSSRGETLQFIKYTLYRFTFGLVDMIQVDKIHCTSISKNLWTWNQHKKDMSQANQGELSIQSYLKVNNMISSPNTGHGSMTILHPGIYTPPYTVNSEIIAMFL